MNEMQTPNSASSAHVTTDPACEFHVPPRGWLARRRFDRARGRACTLCMSNEIAAALRGWVNGDQAEVTCGWTVGPIWKLDGETCVCSLPPDHVAEHACSCGSTFSGCGHAIDEVHE